MKCPRCDAEMPDGEPSLPCANCRIELAALDEQSLHDLVRTLWDDALKTALAPTVTIKGPQGKNPAGAALVVKTRQVTSEAGARVPSSDFELMNLVGKGGMGHVYQARQTAIDRIVAVKVIKPDLANNEAARRLFLSEAAATGELDHPNIIPIYDLGATPDGSLFYAMKYMRGAFWNQVMKEKSQPENLDILMRAADAVAFAHSRGILHRDLKPENVVLGEYGEVMLVDWGLAVSMKGMKALAIGPGMACSGTPAYMAPEMALGLADRLGPASDVYLLGAILFKILTGTAPHHAKTTQEALEAAAANRTLPTSIKGELMDVARRAMATQPEDRFESVKAFQAAIRAYQSHEISMSLSNRAAAHLERAAAGGHYDLFAQAVMGFQEALSLWPENEKARHGMVEGKLAYARSALSRGDLDLARSLLVPGEPAHEDLRKEIGNAMAERNARQRRMTALRTTAFSLAAGLFLLMAAAFIWIRAEKARVSQARDEALVEKTRAEKAQERATAEAENARQQLNYTRAEQMLAQGRLREAYGYIAQTSPGGPDWERGRLLERIVEASRADWRLIQSFPLQHPATWAFLQGANLEYAVTGNGETMEVYDRAGGQPIASITLPESAVAQAPISSHVLAVATEAKRIRLYDVPGLQPRGEWGMNSSVIDMAADPAGRLLAVLELGGRLSIWNVDNQTLVASTNVVLHEVSTVKPILSFSPSGRRLAVNGGFWNKPHCLWEWMEKAPVQISIPCHVFDFLDEDRLLGFFSTGNPATQGDIRSYDISSDTEGHILVSDRFLSFKDAVFSAWSQQYRTGQTNWACAVRFPDAINMVFADSQDPIVTRAESLWPHEAVDIKIIGFDLRSKELMLVKSDRLLIFQCTHPWRVASDDLARSYGCSYWSLWADSNKFWYCLGNTLMRVGIAKDGVRGYPLEPPAKDPDRHWYPWGMTGTSDGKTVAVLWQETGRGGTVSDPYFRKCLRLYDAPAPQQGRQSLPFRAEIWLEAYNGVEGRDNRLLGLTPDGQYAVFSAQGNQATIYSTTNGGALRQFFAGNNSIVSPDNSLMAGGSFSRNHSVRVWRVDTGELVMETQRLDLVRRMAFSPDNRELYVGWSTNLLQVYRVADGELLRELATPVAPVCVLPDKHLYAGFLEDSGPNGSLVLAGLDDGKPIAVLNPSAHVFNTAFLFPDGRNIVFPRSRYQIQWMSNMNLEEAERTITREAGWQTSTQDK